MAGMYTDPESCSNFKFEWPEYALAKCAIGIYKSTIIGWNVLLARML